MNSSKEMPSHTVDENLTRLLREVNFCDEQNVKDLKLEPPTYQPLRLQFTRKSKKVLTDGGNTLNTRRKRRKRGKSNAANSREENKENQASSLKRSDESFLQEWHDDEVEIADYRSSDDSQDEQLEEWFKDLKSNKARDINLAPVNSNARNVGPVIRHEFSNEEKSWLQTNIGDTYLLDMMAKYPTADNPRGIVFDDLIEPRRWIERTHLIAEDAILMKKNRIFTILRQNRPRNLLAHLRLGYCVTHNPGRPICQQEDRTCALQCHICGVCCHMYSCTCRLVKRFQWCSHIHAAVLCGGNKFKNDQQVYFHISSRYNQLAHLRATCFDMANDVKPVENTENAFAVMGWTTEWTPFSVLRSSQVDVCHVCPQYKSCPECSMCRHQYLCACAEYMVKKRLCEHCHVVSIFLSEYRVITLKKREFRYLSDVSDGTDEEADLTRDASPIMLPLRKVAAYHEKSYSIPFKRIQAGSLNDQLVYFVRRCDPDQRFVVHTQNRAHCSCLTDPTSYNVDCIDCRMCRHYLTCNCGEGDAELCKHTHAVQRYIVRSYTPTDGTLESALGSAVRRALSDFHESCDMAKIHSDPAPLVTEENIMAVIENLKIVLGSDVEVELPNPNELSTACDDSTKNRVYNVEAVLEEVNQVFDSKDVNNGKVLGEVDSCTTPNNDFFKNDVQNLEPVSEKNDNSYSVTAEEGVEESAPELIEHSFLNSDPTTGVCPSEPVLRKGSGDDSDINIIAEINELNLPSSNLSEKSGYTLKPDFEKSCVTHSKAGESAIMEKNPDFEKQLPSVHKTDFIGTSDSETSLMVDNESQAEIQLCSHSNSDSTNGNNMKSSLDKSVDIDESSREEFRMSKVVDSCMISDTSCGNWQLNPFLRNSNGGIDTSKMGGDEVAVDIKRSVPNGSSQDATNNLVFRSDGSNVSGVCEEKQNEVSAQFDSSRIKTLKSFYDLLFEPVLEIRYKGHVETTEGYPKVLAESSRCVVTVSDSTKEILPCTKLVPQHKFFSDSETKKEDGNSASEQTCKPNLVSKNFELSSIKENCPDLSTVLPNDGLSGFGIEEDIKNGVSLETWGSSLVAQDFESNPKGSVLNWEPVLIQNPSCCPGAERIDEKKFSTEARVPSVVSNAEEFKKNCAAESDSGAKPILSDFNHTCGGFDTGKEDENLIPKEGSGFSNLSKAFKQKSLNIMRKLNLAKYYKKPQKEDTSLSRFFGGRSWSRSRRQRELAVLQSISDDFADTDVAFENFDCQ